MELIRKPFQGALNIVRFNWHFYMIAIFLMSGAFIFINFIPSSFNFLICVALILAFMTMVLSLLISYYIYDRSDLYQLTWLGNLDNLEVLNIHAGFDETSTIIKNKFKFVHLTMADFYDPTKHKEVSIKRARKAFPVDSANVRINTNNLPFQNESFDIILLILAAHEIRNEKERIHFFKELRRCLKPDGQIFVTEHLRDMRNFIAYNIGFLHFYSQTTWLKTFKQANLELIEETKITPFVSTFKLTNDGNTL